MRHPILFLIMILFLAQCKQESKSQDLLVNKFPYDTIFEYTDSLSVRQIRNIDKLTDSVASVPLPQVICELYVIENTNTLRQVKGDDFSVNWNNFFTITRNKQNRIMQIQYGCDTSQNIGYGQDYFFNEQGKLILLISNSAWVSSDQLNAIQEEIKFYFGTDNQVIKKTYNLHNQNNENLNKKDNIFLHKAFPIYWTDKDFINYYKIKD